MPRPPEDIRRRLQELIDRCGTFGPAGQERSEGGPWQLKISSVELWRFLISSLQTVSTACGKESPHYREMEACRTSFLQDGKGLSLDRCLGVLQAALDDFVAGMLMDLRQLVSAETYGDVLESAAHLLEEKYHLPAIALAGAVLESSLRELARGKSVSWTGNSGISKINTALYSANIYDKVVHGEVEAWGKLRNKVDHGDFANPSDIDVPTAYRMVDGVRHFVAKYR
jgi:hypothetical protein